MGLKALTKVVKEEVQPELTVDLSGFTEGGEPMPLRFRAPRVPDYVAPAPLRKELRIAFPELTTADTELETMILTMAACYVPDPEDAGMQPWRAIGGLMRQNSKAFAYLYQQFNEHFATSIEEKKADTKND